MPKVNTTFLITGGGGYLGSVLVPMLLLRKYNVRVLDRFFWGKKTLRPYLNHKNLTLIQEDVRTYHSEHMRGVDVVIDLASLSNDPTGELNPKITLDINYRARVRTAKMAKHMGVKKYILASSCSVYGFRDETLDETSETAPVTTYARASVLAEQAVLSLSDRNFGVTVLRQGTLYGISPRMRFDVVLNTMVLSYFKNKYISVIGGEQWRPILHVEDSARAFMEVALSHSRKINGEIFNVGSTQQNYKIKKLAKKITSAINPRSKIIIENTQSDFRSYRVSFKKIEKVLNFKTKKTPRNTAKEVYLALKNKKIKYTMETRTIDWYKHLIHKDKKVLEVK